MSKFTFGAPATTTSATTGFTFGAPATTVAATGGFSFGAPQNTAPSTFGLTAPAATIGQAFGAPATSAAPTFGAGSIGFGLTAAPATAAATPPSFGFGSTATSAAPLAFSFGATTTTAASSFNIGTPATTTVNATPSLGLDLLGTRNSAAPTLGLGGATAFSFGKPTATTTPSLNFGTASTSATPFAVSGGLFAKPAAATTTTAATTFLGLGGIDVSSAQPKLGDSKQDIKVKETKLPEEIGRTVDALKTYIKAQKTISSDISRSSASKLTNVSNEILNLQGSLMDTSNAVETNYNLIKLMRRETSKTIQTVEMAQRTQDTPAGLQYENTAPFQYFQSLVSQYEQDLVNFREQISLTEMHMHSLTNPQSVSPEDLKRALRQITESFISLAGRLHEIHQKVEAQKEQYINLRKYRLHDATNVFATLDDPEAKEDVRKITSGPTPFSNISAMSSFGKSFGNTSAAVGSNVGPTAK